MAYGKKNKKVDVTKINKEKIEKHLEGLFETLGSENTEQSIKEYLAYSAKFHKYSMMNSILIMLQSKDRKQDVNQLASFKNWSSMKGKDEEGNEVKVKLNKGAKGFDIFVPTPFTFWKKDEEGKFIVDDNNKRIPELDKDGNIKKGMRFKTGKVFDISDTNAIEIGAVVSLNHREAYDRGISEQDIKLLSDKIKEEYEVDVSFEIISGNSNGSYNASKNLIKIDNSPERTPEEKISTLLHELGHLVMHKELLLNNTLDYNDIHNQLGEIEGQAESFAYAMAKEFYGIENHSEYYIGKYGNSPEDMKQQLTIIVKSINDTSKRLDMEELRKEIEIEVPEIDNEDEYLDTMLDFG